MVSQATLLQRKREEMKRIDNELLATKEKTNKIISRVLEGEKLFAKKQESFKQQITQFQKFIVDSDRKRSHKLKQIEEEKRQTSLKQQEIIDKQVELKQLRYRCKELYQELQSLRRYQNYLNEVANENDNYSIVDELLQRYSILVETHKSLKQTVSNYSAKIEQYSSRLSKYVKQKQNELLVKNSDLARCLKILDDVSSNKTLLEENLHKQYQKDQEMRRNINQTKLSIINLYDRVYQTYSIKKPSYKYKKPNVNNENNHTIANSNLSKAMETNQNQRKSANDDDAQYGILLREISQRLVDLIDIVQTYQTENQ